MIFYHTYDARRKGGLDIFQKKNPFPVNGRFRSKGILIWQMFNKLKNRWIRSETPSPRTFHWLREKRGGGSGWNFFGTQNTFPASVICTSIIYSKAPPPMNCPFRVSKKDAPRVLGPGAQRQNFGTGTSTQTHGQNISST